MMVYYKLLYFDFYATKARTSFCYYLIKVRVKFEMISAMVPSQSVGGLKNGILKKKSLSISG